MWIILRIMLILALSVVCVAANDKKKAVDEPRRGSKKEILQVVWMVPFRSHKNSIYKYNASSSIAALAYGMETVKNETWLPGYELK